MTLELTFGESFCYTPIFKINGIDADSNDFGEQYDIDSGNAEEGGCGDMQFTSIDPKPEILLKYGISEDEYFEICDQLSIGLSFGSCGLCV